MTLDDGQEGPEAESAPDADPYASGAYEYRDSRLREHHGHIPSWLWIVTLGLIVWGVYYVVAYWNAPHPVIY